jgi:dihydrofolate reductase
VTRFSSSRNTPTSPSSGSGSLVQQLSNLGLIDEYRLIGVPLILGAGKPLFKEVEKRDLKLQVARQFPNGIAVLRYRNH